MTAISVRSLERRFGPTRVLAGLDLEVESGEHVTITGANGSGKTTLLRILCGLLRATAGDVEVLGGTTENLDIRRRIGLVGHSPSLYPRMTAAENLGFWGRMYDAPDAAVRGAELLASLGLDPTDRRPVSGYSQGMRQRVGVARALATRPDLLIADEPYAGLDDVGSVAVASLLRTTPTVVLATHEHHAPGEGRCLALREGRLHSA